MSSLPADVGGQQGALMVESLLYRLVAEWNTAVMAENMGREEVWRPSTDDFKIALAAWDGLEREDGEMAVTHILSILSDQRELFLQKNLESVRPDLETFQIIFRILAALTRERNVDGRAWVVFQSLSDFDVEPDPQIYTSMIAIAAKSRQKDAASRAEKLLREAVERYPPKMSDGIVSGIGVDAFNVVLTSWAKSREQNGPKRAEQLLVYMDQIDQENGSLGLCSPNVSSFTSLIDAYAQQNDWESVCQCEMILNRLLEQYLDGNDDLEPNVATWTIVISAWARLSKKNNRSAADKADRLLKRMESLYQDGRVSFGPDSIAYVTCMNAFAFSQNANGPPRAEEILDEMNERYLDGDDTMKPSARSIKVVIDSWIKFGDMDRAEDLLEKYEDILQAEADANPNVAEVLKDIYRSMLFGWSKCDDPEKAGFYLKDMVDNGMQPDSFCFDRSVTAEVSFMLLHFNILTHFVCC